MTEADVVRAAEALRSTYDKPAVVLIPRDDATGVVDPRAVAEVLDCPVMRDRRCPPGVVIVLASKGTFLGAVRCRE